MSEILRIEYAETLARVQAELALTPQRLERARGRAMSRMATLGQREILRAASQSTGIPQQRFRDLGRIYIRQLGIQGSHGVSFFIGTDAVKAHRLGDVTWHRKMPGARVSHRLFSGAWSWPVGKKTAPAVMERIGSFGRRGRRNLEQIDVVKVEIHDQIAAAMASLIPDLAKRCEDILRHEMKVALETERSPT